MNLDAIDKAVAEKVMGWHSKEWLLQRGRLQGLARHGDNDRLERWVGDWEPTRDLRDAALLQKKLIDDGYAIYKQYFPNSRIWRATVYLYASTVWGETGHELEFVAFCLAALQAYGVNISEFE